MWHKTRWLLCPILLMIGTLGRNFLCWFSLGRIERDHLVFIVRNLLSAFSNFSTQLATLFILNFIYIYTLIISICGNTIYFRIHREDRTTFSINQHILFPSLIMAIICPLYTGWLPRISQGISYWHSIS